MALFKVFKGTSANLPVELHDGYCYFTTDDGMFYIDYLDTDGTTLRRRPISGPGNSIEYIEGTQSTSTGSWTGVTKDPSLIVGKTIAYKLPVAGSGNASLNLTFTNPTGNATSGAIAVYTNTSRVTTHYGAGAVILMTYDGNNWRVSEYWNSNNRDPGYGKITPSQSSATTAITTTTAQVSAGTYNENLNVAAGNKWIELAAANGSSNGSDSLTIAHSISTATAGNYGDSSNQAPGYGSTFKVPYISIDAGGHVTGISEHTVKIPASDNTNTATAADNILDGSNSGTQITYAPYSAQQAKLSFDTSTTAPTRTDRLNLNGYLYATKLYSGGAEVLTAHQSLDNYKTKQTAISDSTGTSESTTATRFIYSISQNANGEISVKTRPLPTYNNYSLPLAASGTRGGIQIGYSESDNNYAVKLSSEKAYVTVPWTDTQVTAVGNHYTPAADANEELTGTLSGTAGTYALNTEYTVLTGVKAQRDAKGHVVGITYTAQKIKDTNNTYTVGNKALKVASNTGTATQAITMNESSSDRTLTISGDGTYLTGAVSGSSNAPTITISHKDPVAVDDSKLTASASGATAAWSIDVVKGITVNRDAKGHVTGISVTSGKIPANPNTDTKVKQTLMANTENVEYKLLTTTSASPTSGTAYEAKYGANLAYNPSTNTLSTGNLSLTGELNVTGNAYLHNQTTIDSLTAGSLLVTGPASFTQIPTAPTAAEGANDTQLATTAFVKNSIASLSTAMHFIGKATVAITDGSTTDPTITGYDFTADRKPGDVIIDNSNAYEYVWTTEGKWERLGPDGSYKVTQSAVDTGAVATNKWVARIQQNTNGVITATMGTLDTSGTWSGNAATATKATQDGSGNNIVNTYLTKAAGVTNVAWDNTNKKLTKTINGTTSDVVAVTVNNPTLAWNTESVIAKIGTVDVKVKLPANPNTNTDTLVKQTAKSDDVDYKILMTTSASPTSGNAAEAAYDSNITINPSTNTITASIFNGALTGNASSATALKNGGRKTDANIDHVANGGAELFLATSTMTSNKPMGNGQIIHFHWDTAEGWDSQLYIPDTTTHSMQWRTHSNATTWQTGWNTLLDDENYTDYALTKTGTAGDIVYWSANNTPAHLAKGTDGQVLKLSGGVPVWSSDNNTDTKVNVVARGTTKAYLLADTTAPTSTAAAHTAVAETGVYLDTTAGKLVTTSLAADNIGINGYNTDYRLYVGGTSDTKSVIHNYRFINLTEQGQLEAYRCTAIALCQVSTAANHAYNSSSIGELYFHRPNGLAGAIHLTVAIEDQYAGANYFNYHITGNYGINTSMTTTSGFGYRPCTFVYNEVTYGGIIFYWADAQLDEFGYFGFGNFDVFAVDYYSRSGNGSILNNEIYGSINFDNARPARDVVYAQSFNGSLIGNADSATALTSNAGGTRNPIYFTGGKPTAGAITFDTLNANRLMWTSAADKPYAGYHYANSTKIAINSTTEPTTNLLVNGTAKFQISASDSASSQQFIIGASGKRYLSFGGAGLQAYDASGNNSTLWLNFNGGTLEVGSSANPLTESHFYGTYVFPTANGFTYSGIGIGSDDAARPVWFSYNGVVGRPVYDNDFKYNPATNVLTVGSITGSAGSVAWANITGKPSSFTPSSHTHYELATIGDQRSTATTPNTYANRFIFQGLKTNTVIGSPSSDRYSYVVGLRGWSDSSGGDAHELAFNNTGIYWRSGATTSWGNWYRIYTTGNKPTKSDVGLGNVTNDTQIPKSIGTTKGDIIYWSDASAPARLGIGSAGQVLKVSSSNIPAWSESPFHTALTSKGTTATTTAGETYGIAGVATGSTTTIYTKWFANLDTGVTIPANGMVIQIKIPVAGVNAGCAITIDNGANFYPVTLNASERITTQFGTSDTITLQFDNTRAVAAYGTKAGESNGNATVNITGCWRILNTYNSNTTYSAMSVAEMRTGTATTSRAIRADYLKTFLSTLGGTNLTLTHTSDGIVLNHDTSGVTANTYGNTSQQTPAYGDTFNIPYFTVDAQGHVTSAATTTVKLPANSNTDENVTQTISSGNAASYRVLLSGSADDTTKTEGVRKDTNIRWNPSTHTLDIAASNSNGVLRTGVGTLSISSASTLYLNSGSTASVIITRGGANTDNEVARFNPSGHFIPGTTRTHNIGESANLVWKNVYADFFHSQAVAVTSSGSHGFQIEDTSGNKYGNLYVNTLGTTSTVGVGGFSLGNSIASGTDHNAKGTIWLFGTSTKATAINSAFTGTSAHSIMYFPNHAGPGYLAHTASDAKVGDTDTPVYVAANGRITAISTANLKAGKDGSGNTITSKYVTVDTAQTVSATKTFSAIQTFTNTTDSTHSQDTDASVSISGGLSVAKNVSAKSVRIDNNESSKGASLEYDATLEVLNFVFS